MSLLKTLTDLAAGRPVPPDDYERLEALCREEDAKDGTRHTEGPTSQGARVCQRCGEPTSHVYCPSCGERM